MPFARHEAGANLRRLRNLRITLPRLTPSCPPTYTARQSYVVIHYRKAGLYKDARGGLYKDARGGLYKDARGGLYKDARGGLYKGARGELYRGARGELYRRAWGHCTGPRPLL
jgi:hypothetical protein